MTYKYIRKSTRENYKWNNVFEYKWWSEWNIEKNDEYDDMQEIKTNYKIFQIDKKNYSKKLYEKYFD